MTYNPTFERNQRVRVIERWSEVGVLDRRSPLPIEQAFKKRVEANPDTFFRPIAANNLDVVDFHRELSYLLDASDSLPSRVDLAFDSTWKAFELETKQLLDGDITDRLEKAALNLDVTIVAEICSNVPVQTCEYAYKRLVIEFLTGKADHGLPKRYEQCTTSTIRELLEFMKLNYGNDSMGARRKGTLLMRRTLQGETLRLGSNLEFELDKTSRVQFLILLVLYTLRNEPFHGSSFSPFVSSDATLRTYTHPFFAFLASYYLLIALWLKKLVRSR